MIAMDTLKSFEQVSRWTMFQPWSPSKILPAQGGVIGTMGSCSENPTSTSSMFLL